MASIHQEGNDGIGDPSQQQICQYMYISSNNGGSVLTAHAENGGSSYSVLIYQKRVPRDDTQLWCVQGIDSRNFTVTSKLNAPAGPLWRMNGFDGLINQIVKLENIPFSPSTNKLMWKYDGTHVTTALPSGNVLDIVGSSTSEGAQVQLHPQNGGLNQSFSFNSVDCQIAIRSTNLVLQAYGMDNIICNEVAPSDDTQLWHLEYDWSDVGTFQICSKTAPNMVMTYSSAAKGTVIGLTDGSGDNTKWRANGYNITTKDRSLYLSANGDVSVGRQVILWDPNCSGTLALNLVMP